MPNVIQHKRSSSSGSVPGAGSLAQGEIGINIGDGKFYTKNSSNNIINLGVTSISGTTITPASGLFSGNVRVSSQTTNTIASFDSDRNIVSLNTSIYPSLTELTYVKDVTSSIQTQLNNKANTNQTMFIGTTSVAINRTTGSQTLTGVSIDGNAGTATAITSSGSLTSQHGNGNIGYSYGISNGTAGLFTASNNANSVLTVNRHPGNYYSQLGFSSNGNLYYRNFNNVAIDTTTSWQTIWTSASLTNLNQLTNGPGYTTNNGTVTNVSALTIGTNGSDVNSSVTNSSTTPVITLNIPTASASNRGVLSSADWTIFNNKQNALTNPVTGTGIINHVAYWNSSSGIVADSGQLVWDATNNRLGIGTNSPSVSLDVVGAGRFTSIDINNSLIAGSSALTVNGSISTQSQQMIAGQFSVYGDQNTKLYKPNSTTFAMSSANSGIGHSFGYLLSSTHIPWMTINNTGVGIGIVTPSGQLHVIGNGIFSSGITASTGNFTTDIIGALLNIDNLRLDGNTISSTSGNIIISPSGTGALQRDAGGNARGQHAVDWQTVRSAGTMVASGPYGVICGGSNNTSSNAFSTVGGGISNTSSGNRSTVGGGSQNTSSGHYSTVGGGGNNLSLSSRSFIGAGQNNVAAEKARRANSINGITNTITVLNATAADFDNTTPDALQIGYRSFTGSWLLTTRTVSSATQSGNDVTVVVTSNVGGSFPDFWQFVTVVNIAETDNAEGQVVGGGNSNINSGSYSTVGGGRRNISSGFGSTLGGGANNTSSNIYSTVGGGTNNTSSGPFGSTVGGGNSNISSNAYSTVGGGRINISSGNNSTVGGGSQNISSGNNSTVGGGNSNISSNAYSTVGGGRINISSGINSTVGGGISNISSGNNSTVGGGSNNTSSGDYGTVIGGLQAVSNKHGEVSHSSGRFSVNGDAQHSILIARRNTTDNTANQVLFLNGSSARLTLPAKSSWTFTIKLSAYNNTNDESGWWIFRGGIRRNSSNNTVLVGSVISESGVESSLSTASASVVADNTNQALEIRVTGVANKDIRWVAVVDISQVIGIGEGGGGSLGALAFMSGLNEEFVP